MNKIMATLVSLTMVMAMFMPLAVGQVEINVEVQSGGNPPVVEKIWVLDYVNGALNESGDTIHAIPGTQILPKPGSGIIETDTEFWKYVVVSDPNGIADISTVFEKLFNTTGTQIGPEVTATDITNTPEHDESLNAALKAGLINSTEYADFVWKLDPLKKLAKIYKVRNTLNNHDKPGTYTVEFKVVDTGGAYGIKQGIFTYNPLKALELDFNSINYGPISVNVEKWVAGDNVFGTSDKPTLKNQGNTAFQVKINASSLAGQYAPIQYIPATALSVELLGEHVFGLATPVILQGLLQPCTPTQISFDIKAPLGTTSNTYKGDLTIAVA